MKTIFKLDEVYFEATSLGGNNITFSLDEFHMSGDSDVCYINGIACNYDSIKIHCIDQILEKLKGIKNNA